MAIRHPRSSIQKCPPKIGESIYLEGGVQFITSRILLVDFLCGRVPVENVAGIVVYRAHQVLTSFQESFILRMFREKKRGGFVKAFTDFPSAISSLGELQRLVTRLYVKRVRILPRFDTDVKVTFERTPVSVTELSVDVPPLLRRCLSTLVELLKVCGRELKTTVGSSRKNKSGDETEEESLTGIAYLPTQLEKEIADRRSFATEKQRRLLNEIAQLRKLLMTAENIDACTLLARITAMKTENEGEVPTWMLATVTSRLFTDIESLAGCSKQKGKGEFQPPPKWAIYANVLEEIGESEVHENVGENGPSVLVFTSDDALTRQLADLTKTGLEYSKQAVRRQLPIVMGGVARVTADSAPLWQPEDVQMYTRDEEDHGEIVKELQANQKTAARATKRRRQVAQSMMTAADDGKVQTKIVQFGILHHKKKKGKKGTEEPSTSKDYEEEVKQEEEDEVKETTKVKDAKAPLVIASHGQRNNVTKQLEALQPAFIILYNMDMVTLRQIEIYKALNAERALKVFVLQYRNSTEEDRYLSAMSRERMAFENLTREMQTLLIPRSFDAIREDAPRLRLAVSSRDGGGYLKPDGEEEERPKIIVDMREFQSELPTVIYKKGYDVVAATLEVGDYVLTPDTVVERKALDDLTQSLQSGRVFKQTEQMLRHYDKVVLLIESGVKFDSRIVNGGPFQGELSRHCREIRMQLCMLVRKFPRMRIIWSSDPDNSAEFFTELKMNKPDPDLATAISFHGDDAVDASVDESQSSSSQATKAAKPKKLNAVIQRVLTEAFPFLGAGDIRKLMMSDKIKCVADLFRADTETLAEILSDAHAERIALLTSFDFATNVE
ncbi:xpf-1 [Pristionchus pacificus]|nr:xpf-1 [Pristionchus pacificus]